MPAIEQVKAPMVKSEAESVVDAASEDPKTFTCFPKLPVELRLKIWGCASSITRNVDIWARSLEIEVRSSYQRALYFNSTLSPPAVLHVNSESRSESLKYYDLDFGTSLTFRHMESVPLTISSPSRVYFNWNTDRLCLVNLSELGKKSIVREVSSQLADYHGECQKKGLRHFAINIALSFLPSFPEQHTIEGLTFLKHIPRKSTLEEVVLFECPKLADSDTIKINRLELEDLGSEEQSQRMKYATRVLKKALKKVLERNGETSVGRTSLIRTCKVNFELI